MKRYAVAMALTKSIQNGINVRVALHVTEAVSSHEALGLAVLQVAKDHVDFLVASHTVLQIDGSDTQAPAAGQEGAQDADK